MYQKKFESKLLKDGLIKEIAEFFKKKSSVNTTYKEKFHKYHNCIDFLNCFNEIFTVNYDPLMYWELLESIGYENGKPREEYKVFQVDGFSGEQRVTAEDIIHKLKTRDGIKVYYLHGASYIRLLKKEKTFYKLDPDHFLLENTFDKSSADVNEVSAFILESRWFIKKEHFAIWRYLSYCRKKLVNSKDDMLIFGMSFENDAHILHMLMKYASNNEKNKRKVYITYVEGDELPKKKIGRLIEEHLKSYYENNHKLRKEYKIRKHLLLDCLIQEIKVNKELVAKGSVIWS